MTPTRDDLELYVSGNFDGDIAALERAISEDPALAAIVAGEAELELLLRDAAAAATFCPACDDLVRGERCDQCGAAMRPGGYTVERVLVSNAHGRMYLAHDADGKQVALKELAFVHAPSAATIAAFEREAKFLRALEHPAIPRFCASFEEGQGVHTRYYLAQELVVGTALHELDDHWYTEVEIVDIAKQVLTILAYLQALSPMVIHRDIKPANLLKRPDGTIALVDFGAAYAHGTTAGVTTVGTFGYMPLEQLAGVVDATTDLYALGASLLHLLTRQEPWRLAQTRTIINVSAPLRAFLDKLVAPDPRDRFASATVALAALETRDQLVTRRRSGGGARIAGAATLGVALLASGAGVFHMLRSNDASPEVPVPAARASGGSSMTPLKVSPAEVHEAVAPRIDVHQQIDVAFKSAALHTALQQLASRCGLSLVIPESIDAKVTVQLADVPCDQVFEVLLESHGLWYTYLPASKLLRVAPRKELDAEAEKALARAALGVDERSDELPAGGKLDLDFKDVALPDLLRVIGAAGGVNVVVPQMFDGRITIRMAGVPWNHALEAVLASQGLWYRYRANGKLVRVASRKELDAEAEADLTRSRRPAP